MSIKSNTVLLNSLLEQANNLPDAESGGVILPTLINPASASHIISGYEAISSDGSIITGTLEQNERNSFPYTITVNNNLGISTYIFYGADNTTAIVVANSTYGEGDTVITGGSIRDISIGMLFCYYYIDSITDNVILTITYDSPF